MVVGMSMTMNLAITKPHGKHLKMLFHNKLYELIILMD